MSEGKRKTILLVEDEAILALTEKMQLEKYGYSVITVANGEESVRAVDSIDGIDLILMDINLGDGIDGTEAAETILEHHDIPIVFVSSHTEPEIVEKTEKITSYGYVVKNSSITVLDASIKMAFKLFLAKKMEIAKERALALSEEKYRLISENTSDGIVHFTPAGEIDYTSPSYLRQLGYPENAELGRGYNAILAGIHPDDHDTLFASIFGAIREKKEELTYTYRIKHAKGHYIWREDHANFMYDATGQYLGAYVSCRDITERKNIENKLIVLSKAIEASPAIIVITDADGSIEYVNPKFTDVTGYSNEEAIGKNPRMLKSGRTDGDVYIDLWNTLSSGNEWKGFFKNRKKNGDVYFESATIAPVKNHKGETTNYIAVKEDLTEKRYMEDSLEESYVRFNTLAGSRSVLVWEAGTDKLCTYFNPTWLSFTGRKLEEELGNGWTGGVHPDDLERCLKTYGEAFDNRQEFSMEYRLRKANGDYGWIFDHGSPKYHDQKFVGYIGSCIDISQNKTYENTLRESEEKYRLLHENAGVGIGYFSLDGIVLSFNQLAAKHMGGVPADFIGKSIYDLFPKPDADAYSERIRKAASADLPVTYEDTVQLPTGNKYFLSTFTRISDIEGKLLGVQIISQEITKQKQMEDALRRSNQKAEMLLDVAAEIIISEDFDGNILLLNESGHRILGYESPELVGRNIFDCAMPGEIRDEMREYFKSLKNGSIKTIFTHENELLTKTGERRTIYWHNAVIKDELGQAIGLFSSGADITERKKLEAELIESERRFKKILQDHPSLAVQGYGIDGITNYWNKASERLYGYTAEEAIGRNLLDLIIPESMKDEVARAIKTMLETGEAQPESELSLVRKNGSIIDVLSSHAVVKSSNHPPELFCIDIDISDRKKNEEALRASKETAEMLLDLAAEIILSTDLEGNILLLNPSGHRMLGYAPTELVGKNWFDTCLPGEERDGIVKYLDSLVSADTGSIVSHENDVITKSGERKTISWHNSRIRDTNGKIIGWFSSGEDVTERNKTQMALRVSQERFRFALEGSDLGEWDWDLKTNKISRNERWAGMLGYSPDEIDDILQQGIDLQHPDDRGEAWKAVQAHLDGKTDSYSIEYRMRTKSGKYKWIRDCGKIMARDELGHPLRVCGTHADIDEQKIAGERIKGLLSEKELLLKEVHHRIKNNMNTISSLLSIQAGTVTDPGAIAALEDAGRRIQSMSMLYDKLYRSISFTELSFAEYVSSLVDEVVANFPNCRSVMVRKNLEDFLLDAKRLQTLGIVVNELLTNTMKYAFKGRAHGLVTVSAAAAGDSVVISIQDDGIGMPESVSFENSTGFGLQLVNALAQQLGGTIHIERGNGTKIVLEFKK